MMAKDLSLFQYQAIRQYKTSGVAVLWLHTKCSKKAGDQETLDPSSEIGRPPYEQDQVSLDTVMVEHGLMQPYEIPSQETLLNMFNVYKTFYLLSWLLYKRQARLSRRKQSLYAKTMDGSGKC